MHTVWSCHLPEFPVGLDDFGLVAISTAGPAQTDLQREAAFALGVCLEMAPLHGFRQVFKMCFISDRHLFILMLEKAGQRTEVCV